METEGQPGLGEGESGRKREGNGYRTGIVLQSTGSQTITIKIGNDRGMEHTPPKFSAGQCELCTSTVLYPTVRALQGLPKTYSYHTRTLPYCKPKDPTRKITTLTAKHGNAFQIKVAQISLPC